jgi:hypothetical protein
MSLTTSAAAGAGGGQSCMLTRYNPALGGINGGGTYADGGTYHTSDTACAAPPQYAFGTSDAKMPTGAVGILDRLLHHATALFTAMNNAIYGVSHSPNVSETCSPQSPALDALCQARFPSWGSRMRRRNAPRYQRARSRKRRGCSR